MPFGSRTLFAGLVCACLGLASAASPLLPGAGPVPPPTAPDSLKPGVKPPTDSASARAATTVPAPGISNVTAPAAPAATIPPDADSSGIYARKDSASSKRDTARPVFRWTPPFASDTCKAGSEGPLDCWRQQEDLANQDIGFPGPRAWSLSLTNWRPLPQTSPYFPFWSASPYLSGGLQPPERYSLRRIGGDLAGIEEAWTPVAPLDTPITRLDWTRGAVTFNMFDLRLNRMLSDRVYLGLEYYTSTADSLTYNYQFNVHQPYLGGWGVFGQIYGPIDRDSASLVLKGTSHAIHALAVRPRVGFWIDTNRVVEVFLDQVKNSSNLAFPTGQPQEANALLPTGPDTMQALMPAGFSSFTQGLIYGESHRAWTGQFEMSHGGATIKDNRGRGTGSSRDELEGELFRGRAALAGTGLFLRPSLELEARSETWIGDPSLGWMDAEEAGAAVNPEFGGLEIEAGAGLGRNSRMADKVEWLPRYGAHAAYAGRFGLGAEASVSSRAEDPDWQTLYRTNPARFRFANPELKPRNDRTLRGAVSWALGRYSIEAGIDRFHGEDVWLPRVLPSPGACGALTDSIYLAYASRTCVDTNSVGADSSRLTDTLALGLRNYAEETIDAWHLGLGLALGNWSLRLSNRFVLSRTVDDPDLKATMQDLSVPERVFKGRLNWKRSLLEDRLKLDFAWDWEWYSTRYAWAPDLSGRSRVVKLDEYLALDFGADMHIQTFTLYFKARNFNHDRYATEPGVHPPGVNFRFGVDWALTN